MTQVFDAYATLAPQIRGVAMHARYIRLLQAADEMRGWKTRKTLLQGLQGAGVEINSQVLGNWKVRGVPDHRLVAIANALGCRAEWLATGRGTFTADAQSRVGAIDFSAFLAQEAAPYRTSAAVQCLQLFEQLTPDQQSSVVALLRSMVRSSAKKISAQ